MNGPRGRRPRSSLTLLQMMKLVVFAAAASLCLSPVVRLVEMVPCRGSGQLWARRSPSRSPLPSWPFLL